MFNCRGKLLYYPSWWLILKVDEDICRYYRNLIYFHNRSIKLNSSKNGAHITVIAGKYQHPDDEHKLLWGKYEGEKIKFKYNSEIETNDEYFWVKIECKRIEDIRVELGLPPKIIYPWHLTIGKIIK